jgi:hypothetical protein
MMALVGLPAFNFPVILPVLARQTFHGNGGTYGLLSTMLSIGSVAGSLGVGLIHHPRRQYLMTAALAFGVLLAATAGAPDIAIACLTLLATGATAFSFVTLCSTALQLHSSPAYRGQFLHVGHHPLEQLACGLLGRFHIRQSFTRWQTPDRARTVKLRTRRALLMLRPVWRW